MGNTLHTWRRRVRDAGRVRLLGRHRSRGQSLVELALLLPLLVLLAFGVADLARGYAMSVDVTGQAQVGARALGSSTSGSLPAPESGCSWTTPNPYPTPPYSGSISVTYTCTFSPVTPLLNRMIGTPKVVSTAVTRAEW